MKSFVTWPKRRPRFSMSILLSASATLPKCITSTSRVSKTTGQSILASTTWEDKSWWRLESVQKHLHAFCNVVPMWPRLLGSLHQLPVERDSNIFPDDISVTTCAGCKGEEVEEVLGGKASRLQQLLQRQRSRQKSPTHSGEERYFWEFCQSLPGPARPESSGSCWRHLQLCVESKAQQEMVDVSNPTWNSVEPVSLEVFLLWFQLLHRLPDKRRNLDILPGSGLILGSIHSLLSWREKTWKSFCTAFTDGQVSRESLEESQEESNVLLQEEAKTKYNFHLMFQEIKTNKQTKYLFQLLFQERATKKSSIPHIGCNRTCDVCLQKQDNQRQM